KALELRSRDEAVIHRNAHLAVLDRLGSEDLANRFGIDGTLGENRRALAAQLEGHGNELFGGSDRDAAPNLRAAGVEQMVPTHAGELAGQREPAADDVDAVAIEGRVDHLAEQLPAGGGVLGGLDHDTVAG